MPTDPPAPSPPAAGGSRPDALRPDALRPDALGPDALAPGAHRPDALPPFDAIVLAGGRGRRLGDVVEGTVKPEVLVGGVALVDHVLAAVAGARRVVLVAPPQVARPGVLTVLEDPPDGGPVAGVAAGLTALRSLPDEAPPAPDAGPMPPDDASPGESPGASRAPDLVVVLACDVPHAARAVPSLLAAANAPDVDGARLVASDGRPQHLVAAYRHDALAAALAALPSVRDVAVRRLVEPLRLADVPDTTDAAADADTWDDVARLDAALTRGTIESANPPDGRSTP
ncbi:hypothetical protein Cch01nite_15360 [Cellulomonas chitinilytica]|uniref:MobA-like NTP transferase domain-containing protein n=1 Tax=Cellulomonas chitinilytica TaxID=398759 RepID=A0A919U1T5_9CELL|nr:NTP transferase domain-containing protein [Cellulomonas chitinilytica]GIG20812.1 hypothetical protein Cch01nite_15360 [Cellulomonas chitinilytica]